MSVTAPHNLRLDRTTLFGRESERARLREALADERIGLLTLTGMGGIGKTRLAVAAAHDVLDLFGDGVWFVDLAAITAPDLVAPAIAEVLGVAAERGPELAGAIGAAIGDRSILLILDNFEQVTLAAPVVSTLIEACPRLKVIVTSRTVLGLRGERPWPVEPLPLPNVAQLGERPLGGLLPLIARYPAVGLFVDRAQAADPSFALGEGNVRATVELCWQLDGLPLALELAAGRARVLSPAAMLQRVGERLSLLGSTAVDRPERHRSLAATIEWSHDLLSEAEQALFRRLGVFTGGFTAEAVEAVCAMAGDDASGDIASGGGTSSEGADGAGGAARGVLDALDGLIGKSLVRSAGEVAGVPRFGLLEVLHEYASAKLRASGELEALQRAHAWHLVHLVERVEPLLVGTGSEPIEARATLIAEQANLRAALRWSLDSNHDAAAGVRLAAGLRMFWQRELFASEGGRWLEKMLATGLGAPGARALAHRTLGLFAYYRNDGPAAETHMATALDLLGSDGDPTIAARIAGDLGSLACKRGDHARARGYYTQAYDLGRTAGGLRDVVAAANSRGLCWYHVGDLRRARRELEEVLVLARQSGDDVQIGRSFLFLAWVTVTAGGFADARPLMEQAMEHFTAAQLPYGATICRVGLAVLDHIDGNIASAARTIHECLEFHAEHDDAEAIGFDLFTIASLAGAPILRPFAGPITPPRARAAADRPPSTEALKMATRLTAAGVTATEGAVLIPHEQRLLHDQTAALRTALGRPAFDAAWATGAALDRKGAVAEALAVAARLAEAGDAGEAAGAGHRPVDGESPAGGESPVASPVSASRAADPIRAAAHDSGLSPRELDVADWVAHGLSNREIGERMAVSVKTVEKHISNILAKLGFHNRREIAAWGRAQRHGSPPDAR